MNSIDQTVADIKKIYQTTDPFYLSSFYQPGGDKQLYDFLTSVYRPEYDNNFRILIVQDCVDVYDYQAMPGLAVTTLQKNASQLDISNFFILIITVNKNIQTELEQVQRLYSTDDCKIQSVVVDGVDYVQTHKKQDTFCVLPWMHLYVGPNGDVLPCCSADQLHPMGNIEEQSIESIAKSSKFNQLRSNMLNGQRSKECKRCYSQEDSGLTSHRVSHNLEWPAVQVSNLDPTGAIESFDPVYLDIRLNNICNLKCRMCSGYFSSAIAQEEIELFNNKKFVESSMRLQQRTAALGKVIKYLPHCERIYFAGGEPLLASEHYDILDSLILHNNVDLKIIYNTNFTTLHYKSRNVLDLWKQFSNITIGASLDAHGNVAEYVRHGTVWVDIESNLKLLQDQCPHVNFTVTSTVGLLNAASLIELQQDWHNTNKLDISKFSLSTMIGPAHLTVAALPTDHKHRLEELIKDHIAWCLNNYARSLANQWNNVLTYMWATDHSYQLAEFRRLTNLLDQHRNQSLAASIPELKNLLNTDQ